MSDDIQVIRPRQSKLDLLDSSKLTSFPLPQSPMLVGSIRSLSKSTIQSNLNCNSDYNGEFEKNNYSILTNSPLTDITGSYTVVDCDDEYLRTILEETMNDNNFLSEKDQIRNNSNIGNFNGSCDVTVIEAEMEGDFTFQSEEDVTVIRHPFVMIIEQLKDIKHKDVIARTKLNSKKSILQLIGLE
ncbi:hypothetical protein DAMA08_006350 [Martiniozyma asiatica (nom. inval.)]|nr:hypothetical protein DAMA08_006350 [Martiniozyma asiatica]